MLFATTASFGMLVMALQNLGLIGLMTVQWPTDLDGIFAICQLILLDIDNFGFSCVAGTSAPIRYLLSALIFPIGVSWLALAYLVSRLLIPQDYAWEGPKVCSTVGAFLQLGFSTMSATSLAPMMCYKHPNGIRSLLKYPGVFCGSPDHAAMLVIGWLLLSVLVLFVTFCTFAVIKVPKWSAMAKGRLVAAVRFLISRFRLDSWWFGVPLLIRGPLINLPIVLATDYPPIQVVSIAVILTFMMLVQMLAWPWKVPLLNLTDCIISFGIVMLVTTSALFLPSSGNAMHAFAEGVSTTMLICLAISVAMMFVMTVSALFWRSALGGTGEIRFFNLGKTPDCELLAAKIKSMAAALEQIEMNDLSENIQDMSVFDIQKITTCITLLATEVGQE